MFVGLVEVQILSDKVLVGEPLDASQAFLFVMDDSYPKRLGEQVIHTWPIWPDVKLEMMKTSVTLIPVGKLK
jgi:hypothetical protein